MLAGHFDEALQLLPYRSRIACSGATSPNTYTVPSVKVRSHPCPFQVITDL
jgi:hypothetical protein